MGKKHLKQDKSKKKKKSHQQKQCENVQLQQKLKERIFQQPDWTPSIQYH